MRHGVYYAPKAIPCDCGSTEAYWHGPEGGLRVYCCKDCWARITSAPSRLQPGEFPCGGCGSPIPPGGSYHVCPGTRCAGASPF